MDFEILGQVRNIQTMARGRGIREFNRLQRTYGGSNWRKVKGIAHIRLSSGDVRLAELHWYGGHGVGRREVKRKRYLG